MKRFLTILVCFLVIGMIIACNNTKKTETNTDNVSNNTDTTLVVNTDSTTVDNVDTLNVQ